MEVFFSHILHYITGFAKSYLLVFPSSLSSFCFSNSLLGQIYIHVLNKELEKQKEESEDGKTRRYDFAKPII